jgi:hypothetical protein
MAEHMKALGKIIICMDKEYTRGVTVVNMTASTIWTKSMVSECTFGQTADGMKGTGPTESNMARVNICSRMESLKLECGKTERGCDGSTKSTHPVRALTKTSQITLSRTERRCSVLYE